MNGSRQAVIIDEQVAQTKGPLAIDGMNILGGTSDLHAGKCVLSIESITENDFGLWSCALVTTTLTIFTGVVNVGKRIFINIYDQSRRSLCSF